MVLHQGIPLSQFMSCPICLKPYNEKEYRPISLACGHSVCKCCIMSKFGDKKCPFDQAPFPADVDKLPANYALMQVIGATIPERDRESPPSSSSNFPQSYLQARHCIEEMAVNLKPLAENSSDDETKPPTPAPSASSLMSEKSVSKCVLSRPIQRKLISLIHCQLLEEDGRSRSARIARSIGERIVTELLSLQQYSQQLSANLWAAVRTRGCQFLGPAMQEEVLRLILLALEDGSFLSRKVLVLFVVQRLESRYPQASKTAIGHVVQLLYRASCFKVLKRDEASSLMQLRDEFRQYEALRKEHDAQIVQMALEAGLRIPPEHWSSLLYGDSSHKSHMQSIIDKHQSAQSFVQCIAELVLTLQRNGDPCNMLKLQPQFEFISSIDPSTDCPAPSWENLEAVMRSLNTVMKAFIGYLSGPDHHMRLESMAVPNTRYKTSMCRDFLSKGTCPRGSSCTFAHSQDEMEKHRVRSRRVVKKGESGEKSENAHLPDIQLLSQLTLDSTLVLSDPSVILNQAEASISSSARTPDNFVSSGHSYATPLSLSSASTLSSSSSSTCTVTSSHHSMNNTSNNITVAPVYKSRLPAAAAPLVRNPPSADVGAPSFMPSTRLTFSEPAKDVPEIPFYPPMGPQTSLHPHNSSVMGLSGSGHTFVPHGHPAFPKPHPSSDGHQPWFDPHTTGHRLAHPNYKPLDSSQASVAQIQANPPLGMVTEQYGVYSPGTGVDALSRGRAVVVYPCANCQPQAAAAMMSSPLSHSVEHQESALQRMNEVGHVFVGGTSQDISLEDLTSRKKQIISHLQEEPTFLDPMAQVYKADSAKGGFDGLKTVLGKNMKKRGAMPKLVSDMFVATRSTQSLDKFMYEDPPPYHTQWSTGEDVSPERNPNQMSYSVTPHDEDSDDDDVTNVSSTLFTPSAQEAPCAFSSLGPTEQQVSYTSQCPGTLYNSLGSSMEFSDTFIPQSSHAKSMTYDSEFCRFPTDDDESFIPFEHTSVSKFGPISRMARAKTHNCAPVQVTADSSKRLTPVLAVTPLERPLPICMPVTSRFSSVTAVDSLMAEPAVKPTPTEAPSIWQESPQPSYMNIARLKAGAAGAISNNERLAYELQAVELEISMKTGRVPEPVGKIIHEAVMSNLPATKDTAQINTESVRIPSRSHDSDLFCNSRFRDVGLGHVTDCLTMIENGKSLVSSEQAAQHLMEEYYRSCQGLKK